MSAGIVILYTNIGRGHPFYLDGIAQALSRSGNAELIHSSRDVHEVSSGLSKTAWKSVRWLYTKGSSGGIVGKIYGRMRRDNDYNRQSFALKLLGRDIASSFVDSDRPVLVAHPSLVGILRGKAEVIYQHGELVAPTESLVSGAKFIFVPDEKTARMFESFGYDRKSILVTGLCIEPELTQKADDMYAVRHDRIANGVPLTGGLFSSGAEPPAHVRQLVSAAVSVVSGGGRVIVLARKKGRLAESVQRRSNTEGIDVAVFDTTSPIPNEHPPFSVVLHENRREEDALTCQLFERFDYVVAPSHERTNWSIGLGMPMFVLTPTIGPFAPMNLRLLIEHETGVPVDDESSGEFGQFLDKKRQRGELLAMCEAGFGSYPIDGFQRSADFLTERYGG